MTTRPDTPDLAYPPSLWRRHGTAAITIAAVSALIGCGALAAGRAWGQTPAHAGIGALFAATIWISLTAGPLAAKSPDTLGALIRAGATADGSLLTLLAIGGWGGGVVSVAAGAKIYWVWAAVAVAIALIVRLGRSPLGRGAAALAGSILAAITLSGLFWSPGLLAALPPERQSAAMEWIQSTNALAAVTNAAEPAAGADRFVWTHQPAMYRITRAGEDYPYRQAAWWTAALGWTAVGAVAGLAGLARRGWGRFWYGTWAEATGKRN